MEVIGTRKMTDKELCKFIFSGTFGCTNCPDDCKALRDSITSFQNSDILKTK